MDDTCMISTTLCRGCVADMLDTLSPVKFDAEKESTPAPLLDLHILTEGGRPTVLPNFKELEPAPPWACEKHAPVSRMKGMWSRLHPDGAKGGGVMRDILNGIESLAQCGWTNVFAQFAFQCRPTKISPTRRS